MHFSKITILLPVACAAETKLSCAELHKLNCSLYAHARRERDMCSGWFKAVDDKALKVYRSERCYLDDAVLLAEIKKEVAKSPIEDKSIDVDDILHHVTYLCDYNGFNRDKWAAESAHVSEARKSEYCLEKFGNSTRDDERTFRCLKWDQFHDAAMYLLSYRGHLCELKGETFEAKIAEEFRRNILSRNNSLFRELNSTDIHSVSQSAADICKARTIAIDGKNATSKALISCAKLHKLNPDRLALSSGDSESCSGWFNAVHDKALIVYRSNPCYLVDADFLAEIKKEVAKSPIEDKSIDVDDILHHVTYLCDYNGFNRDKINEWAAEWAHVSEARKSEYCLENFGNSTRDGKSRFRCREWNHFHAAAIYLLSFTDEICEFKGEAFEAKIAEEFRRRFFSPLGLGWGLNSTNIHSVSQRAADICKARKIAIDGKNASNPSRSSAIGVKAHDGRVTA